MNSQVLALVAQSAEHLHGKEGVIGSNPIEGYFCTLMLTLILIIGIIICRVDN